MGNISPRPVEHWMNALHGRHHLTVEELGVLITQEADFRCAVKQGILLHTRATRCKKSAANCSTVLGDGADDGKYLDASTGIGRRSKLY